MTELVIAFLLNALWIIGVHSITRKGMLLGFVEGLWVFETKRWKKWEAIRKGKEAAAREAQRIFNEIDHAYRETHPGAYLKVLTGRRAEARTNLAECNQSLEHHGTKKPAQFYRSKISKPLTECPVCMASIHGFAGLLASTIVLSLPWHTLAWSIAWMPCLAGLVDLLTSIAWRDGE